MENKEFLKKIGVVMTQLASTGVFLRENRHFSESIKCFDALSFGDSTYENGAYAYEIALCYLGMGDGLKANEYFKVAMAENPSIYDYKIKELNIKLM